MPVTAGEGAYFRPGDVVLVAETGEKFRVVSIAVDTLTVVRGVGGVGGTATTIATGDLVILANASAQGADTGVLKATKRVLGYNYTQIVRDPMGFTGTDAEIDLYGGDDPEREIAKKAVEHKAHLEGLMWAGGRLAPTNLGADTEPTSFMGGITEFLTSNVFTAMGAPTLETLDVKIQQIYQRGSMNKVAFCGPLAARKITICSRTTGCGQTPGETQVRREGVGLDQRRLRRVHADHRQARVGHVPVGRPAARWSDVHPRHGLHPASSDAEPRHEAPAEPAASRDRTGWSSTT